ncbi:hypothetical protein QYF61_020002 [Mycteria americana]|uniref:Integrase zinc-binding domain-containing protein n=1 Tax=Mycteria americana TaxID=33587 RepID=A0AAN7MM32_MYCAM|nr:hypothetical protein QYF61_019998 [Mycteria americana]KAK4809580.1 hypothetical protein QYF61_020002 [Mycteria americana]
MDWPEGKDFGISLEEEVTRAEEAPLYHKLPDNEKQYALFTDGSCRIVENLVVKVRHVDAHVPKSWATEEHQNNQQVHQAAKIEVTQVDQDWKHKGELFIALWAHDTSGHQGRDATYTWVCDRGLDLTMDTIAQPYWKAQGPPLGSRAGLGDGPKARLRGPMQPLKGFVLVQVDQRNQLM